MDLSWLPKVLHPAFLRIGRADELAYTFGQVGLGWSRGSQDEGPLTVRQVERTEGVLDFEVVEVRPVPPITAMLFSEAINHLRAAIDNALYALMQEQHGEAFTDQQARAIAFPIVDDEDELANRLRAMTKKGLDCVASEAPLGRRIAALQPFNDVGSSIPAVSPALAYLTGETDLGRAHPLKLLQAYSNADKHRGVRLSAAGVLAQKEGSLSGSQMTPVSPGVVLGQVEKGVPTEWSTTSAILLQRPDGRWIPPGPELDQLTAHVAEVVIPTLATGLSLPKVPVHMNLADNAASNAERLAAAQPERALERSREVVLQAYVAALGRNPSFPPIFNLGDLDSEAAD